MKHIKIFSIILVFHLFFTLALSIEGNHGSDEFSLRVYISPPMIPADGNLHRCIYVQIIGSNGEPAIFSSNVTVVLTSSNLEVGSVENSIIIPAGRSFAIASFKTTFKPGSTNITASASGFQADTAILTTVSPYSEGDLPIKLGVYITPKIMMAGDSKEGLIVVQLLDSKNLPVVAFSDIYVTLTSSNTTILSIKSHVIIRKGSSYGAVPIRIKGYTGSATITALAENFLPGKNNISILRPSGIPAKLNIAITPSIILPESLSFLTIQLLDSQGLPTVAEKDIRIYLASSDTEVALVNKSVIIKKGESFKIFSVKSSLNTGMAVITASADGLETATAMITVKGLTPTKLRVYAALPKVIANGEEKNIIVVQVQGDKGLPVPSRGIIINLASSTTDIGSIPSVIKIEKGKTYAVVPFKTTLYPGETNIIASAQGLESASALLNTTVLPLIVTLDVPQAVEINETFTVSIKAFSNNVPVQNAEVSCDVIGGKILKQETLTNSEGKASLMIKQTSQALTIKIKVSKPGYEIFDSEKNIKAFVPEKPHFLEIIFFGLKMSVYTAAIIFGVLIIALTLIYYVIRRLERAKLPSREFSPNLSSVT